MNPYSPLMPFQANGLDAVKLSLMQSYPFTLLNDTVFNYINTQFFNGGGGGTAPPILDQLFVKSVLPDAVNSYTNNNLIGYTEMQQAFIQTTIARLCTFTDPAAAEQYLMQAENKIPTLELDTALQMPLFIAMAIGIATHNYWRAEIPQGASLWYAFGIIDPNPAINTINLSQWTAAAILGSLYGNSKINALGLQASNDLISATLISGLYGGIGLGAGKVIFKWIGGVQ